MIKHLKEFFYPPTITYSYNLSKEIVIVKIMEVFSKKVTIWGGKDMTGMFLTDNIFSVSVVRPALGPRLSLGSTLVGEICEVKKGLTEIKTIARPNFAAYIFFL